MTTTDPNELLREIVSESEDRRNRSKVLAWVDGNGENGKLFWDTMVLAEKQGTALSVVIEHFKQNYDGPPGTSGTVRRVFLEWQKKQQ